MVYRIVIDPMERFINNIDLLSNGCWQWNKSLVYNGYGRFSIGNSKFYRLAHQFAYWVFKGEVPKGLQIDHLCRNRGCVNPEHLEAVTPRENQLRGMGVSAINAQKTHCIRGHIFDYENTYLSKTGRTCRRCKMILQKKYKERNKYNERALNDLR